MCKPGFNEQVQRQLVSMIQSGGFFEAVSLPRSVVEVGGDLIEAGLSDSGHASSFGQILAQRAVEVLVALIWPARRSGELSRQTARTNVS